MIKLIATIAGAITALAGILTIFYKLYLSPAAKLKKKALSDGEKAVDEGDVSGITSSFDRLNRKIIPILIVALLLFSGCSAPIILHPILTIDIVSIPAKTRIVLPNDPNYVTPVAGYFLSNEYIKSVMQAKVK